MSSARTFQRKDLKDVRILPVTGFEYYLVYDSSDDANAIHLGAGKKLLDSAI